MNTKKSLIILFLLAISVAGNSQKLVKVWSTGQILKTPESALYDPDQGVIYVSNVNENPWVKDGNGYISVLNPDGTMKTAEWITGLDGPKGMGVLDGKLYVANIDELVEIDIAEGKIAKRYPANGEVSLNDVDISDDGTVYVSDSNTGKILALKDGQFSVWYNGSEMGKINGLFAEGDKLYVGSDNIYQMNTKTKKIIEFKSNCGGVDGLEKDNSGNFVFSNWPGRIYYLQGEKMTKMIDSSKEKINTADIGFARQLNLVLVPTFFDNQVVAYKIER
jgi:DNA-binding beta-propeller fold protein YncE